MEEGVERGDVEFGGGIARVGVWGRGWSVRMGDVDGVFVGVGEGVDDGWGWEVVLCLFSG